MTGPRAGRVAIMVPGGGSTADVPLLEYARLAVTRRGAHVHRITWNSPVDWDRRHDFVIEHVGAALDAVAPVAGIIPPLLFGKSLGSLAAPVAADLGMPAVWFTPLLTDELTVVALGLARAPCLLIGGTADPLWDGAVARSVTRDVVEIDGADHGMFVPGPASASAAVLGQVMDAVEVFIDERIWLADPAALDRS